MWFKPAFWVSVLHITYSAMTACSRYGFESFERMTRDQHSNVRYPWSRDIHGSSVFFLRSHISFKVLSQHYHSIKTVATVSSAAVKTESSAQLLIKFILHLCLLWITETLLLLAVPKVSHCVLSPHGSTPLKGPANGNVLEESVLFSSGHSPKTGIWAVCCGRSQSLLLLLSSPTTMLLYCFCCCSLNDSFTLALFRPPSLQRQTGGDRDKLRVVLMISLFRVNKYHGQAREAVWVFSTFDVQL